MKRKIQIDKFKELFYKKDFTLNEISNYFNVGISAIGIFRHRNNLPPRGWAGDKPPFLGRKHSAESCHKMSIKLKGRKAWNKFFPDWWICKNCEIKFPNKTGHRRKFCSYSCYWNFIKGKTNIGGFQSWDNHWYYHKDRSSVLNRYNNTKYRFTHKQKTIILKKCNYQCQKCFKKFSKKPVYKLINSGVRYDHKIPLMLGGKHSIKNGQVLCNVCENIKTKKDLSNIIKNFKNKSS